MKAEQPMPAKEFVSRALKSFGYSEKVIQEVLVDMPDGDLENGLPNGYSTPQVHKGDTSGK